MWAAHSRPSPSPDAVRPARTARPPADDANTLDTGHPRTTQRRWAIRVVRHSGTTRTPRGRYSSSCLLGRRRAARTYSDCNVESSTAPHRVSRQCQTVRHPGISQSSHGSAGESNDVTETSSAGETSGAGHDVQRRIPLLGCDIQARPGESSGAARLPAGPLSRMCRSRGRSRTGRSVVSRERQRGRIGRSARAMHNVPQRGGRRLGGSDSEVVLPQVDSAASARTDSSECLRCGSTSLEPQRIHHRARSANVARLPGAASVLKCSAATASGAQAPWQPRRGCSQRADRGRQTVSVAP